MSKTIVIPQMNMRKKILISLMLLSSIALLVYEILFYFSASKKDFKVEMVALIRLTSYIIFIFIPFFLLITRKISLSIFIYSFCFVAGFDVAMLGLSNLWANQSQINYFWLEVMDNDFTR